MDARSVFLGVIWAAWYLLYNRSVYNWKVIVFAFDLPNMISFSCLGLSNDMQRLESRFLKIISQISNCTLSKSSFIITKLYKQCLLSDIYIRTQIPVYLHNCKVILFQKFFSLTFSLWYFIMVDKFSVQQ